MGVSICLVDRSLGKDAKMGHDLLLTMTTETSLPELCTASASGQEPELTRVGKMIISSEKKNTSSVLMTLFQPASFILNPAGVPQT